MGGAGSSLDPGMPLAVGFFDLHALGGRPVSIARRGHPDDHIVAMAGGRHVSLDQAAAVAASPVNVIMGDWRAVEVAQLVRLYFGRYRHQEAERKGTGQRAGDQSNRLKAGYHACIVAPAYEWLMNGLIRGMD